MPKRFFSSCRTLLGGALCAWLALVPAARAAMPVPLAPPYLYVTDEANLTTSSPALQVVTGQQVHDVQPSPNLNGWVCLSSGGTELGGCAATQMGEGAGSSTPGTAVFRKQGAGVSAADTRTLNLTLKKLWMSVPGATYCSLAGVYTYAINYVPPASPPPTGVCSTQYLSITINSNELLKFQNDPGTWKGRFVLRYEQGQGGNYQPVETETISMTIIVTDNDAAQISLDPVGGIGFPSPPDNQPELAYLSPRTLELYDPSAAISGTSFKIRMWDDYSGAIPGRSPTTFSVVNTAVFNNDMPSATDEADYTVGLSAPGLGGGLNGLVTNGKTYTFTPDPTWLAACKVISSPGGKQCYRIPIAFTLQPLSVVTKSSGYFSGMLHIAFGKAT